MSSRPPILLGTEIPPYGIVSAVGFHAGERYYWLHKHVAGKVDAVAMLPANVIEPWHDLIKAGL